MLAEEQERKNTLLKTKENTYIKVNHSFQLFVLLMLLRIASKFSIFFIGRKGEVNFGAFPP